MELIRKTLEKDEEFLRQISSEVDFEKDNYLEYIKKLKDYCSKNAVYALAPVQIGIPKRIIYLKNTTSDMNKNLDTNYNEEIVLINPVILSAKGHTQFLEGCESCLNLVGVVDRPYSVEVEYYTINGEKKVEIFEGFKCTVLCHEHDHLNGILHIDLVSDIEEMTFEQKKNYREKNPYKIISKDKKYDMSLRRLKK